LARVDPGDWLATTFLWRGRVGRLAGAALLLVHLLYVAPSLSRGFTIFGEECYVQRHSRSQLERGMVSNIRQAHNAGVESRGIEIVLLQKNT
jgi:hypothetical protein